MAIHTGILFPQSMLSEPWYLVFALVVAFNTLIYLGLTLSKLIPWPAQMHPSRVRDLTSFMLEEETAVANQSEVRAPNAEQPFDQLRHDAARQSIPRAMVLVGCGMLILAVLNLLAYEDFSVMQSLFGLITAFVFIATSLAMARLKTAASTIITIWTVYMVIVIVEVAIYAEDRNEPVVLVNAVVMLIVLAPISMSWIAGIVGSLLAAAAVLTSGWIIESLDAIPWILASATAVTAGLVLLQLRLGILERLGLEQMRANALASTDPLTGTFSRIGLLTLAETIASAADASGQPVHAVLCDVNDLRSLNHSYGMDYGDEVLQVTARALKLSIPQADLIARWDGDSFLALGVGPIADSMVLTQSMDQAITNSGISLGKRPVSVTMNAVAGSPSDVSFEELLASMTIGQDN